MKIEKVHLVDNKFMDRMQFNKVKQFMYEEVCVFMRQKQMSIISVRQGTADYRHMMWKIISSVYQIKIHMDQGTRQEELEPSKPLTLSCFFVFFFISKQSETFLI